MYCIYKLHATKAIQYVPRYQAHTYGTAPYSPLLPSHQTCLETTRTRTARTVCRPIYSTLPMHPVVYQVKTQFYVSGNRGCRMFLPIDASYHASCIMQGRKNKETRSEHSYRSTVNLRSGQMLHTQQHTLTTVTA